MIDLRAKHDPQLKYHAKVFNGFILTKHTLFRCYSQNIIKRSLKVIYCFGTAYEEYLSLTD